MASELKAYDIDEHPALVSKAREGEGYFGVLIFRIKMHRLYSKVLERPADFMMKIYSLERILLEDDVRQKILRSQALWHLTIEEPTVFYIVRGVIPSTTGIMISKDQADIFKAEQVLYEYSEI